MELMEAVITRRSVREYTGEPVSEEAVEQLLRAAMEAPSAGNQQPWVLIVVRERSRLQRLAAAETHGKMIGRAPLAVVICADSRRVRHEGFWIQDCAAATQNLLLAAHALGLGAVWVGTYPRADRVEGVRAVLGVPEHVTPFSVVAIGHPLETQQAVDRYDPSRVHFESYEERP